MNVGDTVYLRWYDFRTGAENVHTGTVVDNSLWEGTKWQDYVNVQFQPVGMKGPICHHFMPEKLSTVNDNVPHDDCYLVCAKRKDNTGQEPPSFYELLVQQFKEDHWDRKHNHLKTDSLETFYFFWKKAHGAPKDEPPSEALLKEQSSRPKGKCQHCQYLKFSETLGSPDKPVWHCRDGFSPSSTCQEEAIYNDECMEKYPAQRPAGWKPSPQPTKHKKKQQQTNVIQLSLF